jgi:hypothetical protein
MRYLRRCVRVGWSSELLVSRIHMCAARLGRFSSGLLGWGERGSVRLGGRVGAFPQIEILIFGHISVIVDWAMS